jgi:hypothetical protein
MITFDKWLIINHPEFIDEGWRDMVRTGVLGATLGATAFGGMHGTPSYAAEPSMMQQANSNTELNAQIDKYKNWFQPNVYKWLKSKNGKDQESAWNKAWSEDGYNNPKIWNIEHRKKIQQGEISDDRGSDNLLSNLTNKVKQYDVNDVKAMIVKIQKKQDATKKLLRSKGYGDEVSATDNDNDTANSALLRQLAVKYAKGNISSVDSNRDAEMLLKMLSPQPRATQ